MNKVLGKPESQKPAHGHVHSAGVGHRWDYHYPDDKEMRKQRRKSEHVSIDEKITEVEANTKQVVREEMAA